MSARLVVPAGGSVQESGGETSPPSQLCLRGIMSPALKALLVSSNAMASPTAMRKSPRQATREAARRNPGSRRRMRIRRILLSALRRRCLSRSAGVEEVDVGHGDERVAFDPESSGDARQLRMRRGLGLPIEHRLELDEVAESAHLVEVDAGVIEEGELP